MIAVAKPKSRKPIRRINVRVETPISLSTIGRQLPDSPSYFQLLHWHNNGRKNWITGETVFLETVRLPRGLATTVEAYWRFVEALNED